MSDEEDSAGGSDLNEIEAYAVDALAGQTIKEHILDVESLERAAAELRPSHAAAAAGGGDDDEDSAEFSATLRLKTTAVDEKLKENDLKREEEFARIAKTAAEEGLAKLVELQIPFRRPDNYFVEMLKTDTHMEKVRERLHVDREKIEGAVKRRADRENKKNMKRRQVEKEQERRQSTRDQIREVEKLRKQRLTKRMKKLLPADEAEPSDDEEFPEEVLQPQRPRNRRQQQPPQQQAQALGRSQARDQGGRGGGRGGGGRGGGGRGGLGRHRRGQDSPSSSSGGPRGRRGGMDDRHGGGGSAGGRGVHKGKGKGDEKGRKDKPARPGKERRKSMKTAASRGGRSKGRGG